MQVQDIVAILVILLTVWGGISKSIDRAAKKRRQQEMMRQKEREVAGEGYAARPMPVPVSGPMSGPPASPRPVAMRSGQPVQPAQPVDDLTARRRAQLEELRQRRTTRQGAAVPPTFPQQGMMKRPGQFGAPAPVLGPQAQRPLPPAFQPPPPRPGTAGSGRAQEIKAIEANAAAWRRQQEIEARRRRDDQKRRQAEEKAASERAAAAATPPARSPARPARQTGIREIGPLAVDAANRNVGLAAARVRLASLAESIRSPEQIRRAMILKEILDPPLAMRTVDKPL